MEVWISVLWITPPCCKKISLVEDYVSQGKKAVECRDFKHKGRSLSMCFVVSREGADLDCAVIKR